MHSLRHIIVSKRTKRGGEKAVHAIIIFTALVATYASGLILGITLITYRVTGQRNETTIYTNISSSLIMIGFGIAAFIFPIQTGIW